MVQMEVEGCSVAITTRSQIIFNSSWGHSNTCGLCPQSGVGQSLSTIVWSAISREAEGSASAGRWGRATGAGVCGELSHSSCLTLSDPWTAARQAPVSMGSSRQEYWSGLPRPPPGGRWTQGLHTRLLRSCMCGQALYHWQAPGAGTG